MRKFGYLFNQQLNQMFISPSTYIAAFLFLAFMGVIYLYSLVEVSRGRGRQVSDGDFPVGVLDSRALYGAAAHHAQPIRGAAHGNPRNHDDDARHGVRDCPFKVFGGLFLLRAAVGDDIGLPDSGCFSICRRRRRIRGCCFRRGLRRVICSFS